METIYKTLNSLGLSTSEVQIYIFLAQHGPKKKEQMENQLDLDAKELASSLIALSKKGLIEVEPDQSNIYTIIPFDVVFQRLIDIKKEQISSIKREINPS